MVADMKKFLIAILSFAVLPFLFACNDTSDEDIPNADRFKLTAIVKNVGDKIEVEVIESDYAFGEYWVITSDDTEYTDEDGGKILRGDIKQGDKIGITYRGQVMMSYPPQIVATAIQKLN